MLDHQCIVEKCTGIAPNSCGTRSYQSLRPKMSRAFNISRCHEWHMPSSSSLRNSLRSVCRFAPIFMENLEYMSAEIYQHCEGIKEQCQSGNTEWDTQVAFVDDYS